MQMVIDIFAQIFATLWAHKLRSFLTMFGIAWGVGSLLLLVGLGEGFRSGNQRGLSEYGENIMMLFPGRAPAVLRRIRPTHERRRVVGARPGAAGPHPADYFASHPLAQVLSGTWMLVYCLR